MSKKLKVLTAIWIALSGVLMVLIWMLLKSHDLIPEYAITPYASLAALFILSCMFAYMYLGKGEDHVPD